MGRCSPLSTKSPRIRSEMATPLGAETAAALALLFAPAEREEAARLLAQECAENLPGMATLPRASLERVRMAALEIAGGSLERLRAAIALAKVDWRDVLMNAGPLLAAHQREERMVHDATPPEIEAASAYEALHVPALFGQWASRVARAARVGAGDRVLDVACGTGVLAREVAGLVGSGGSVSGLDPSPGMLAVAGRTAPAVDWRQGTADSLPFDDGAFDVVVSQFGLMFFPDRVKALREMLRVLRGGGRFAVAVWDSLERSEAYPLEVELLERVGGAAAANALRAPFVLGDRNALRALFEEAGASDVEVTTITGRARFPSVRVMVEADLRGWLPVMGVELEEAPIRRILEEAERILGRYVTGEGTVEFDSPAHIVSGEKRA